jgi:DNA polymerase-3 subunit beta
MKITITLNDLKLMHKGFGKVIANKSCMPALTCVLFRHEDGLLTATATDLDETLTLHLPGDSLTDAAGPQAFLLAFSEIRRLATTLKKDTPASFHTDGEQVVETVQVDGREVPHVFEALPVADFPSPLETAAGAAFKPVPFLAAYRATLPAVSPDPARRMLASVFLDGKDKTLVATDGRRLMIQPVDGLPDLESVALPDSKVLANGLLEAETGAIAVTKTNTCFRVRIDAGRWTYQCQCPDGAYPNYKQVIPGENMQWAGEVQVAPEDLPAIREAVTQFTDHKAGRDTIVLYVNNGKVVILSADKPTPDGQVPYLVLARSTATVTKPVICALWAPFFVDGLSGGCHRIRIADAYSPLRSDSAAGAIYIQMPWREELGSITRFVNQTFNAAFPVAQPEKEDPMKTKPESVTTTAAEPAPVSTPDTPVTAPVAEPAPVTDTAPVAESAAPEAVIGRPPLQFNPAINPVEELMADLNGVYDKNAAVQESIRNLRQKVRAVERFYKARGREIDAKTQAIAKLKEAVGF